MEQRRRRDEAEAEERGSRNKGEMNRDKEEVEQKLKKDREELKFWTEVDQKWRRDGGNGQIDKRD
jgi:hypothetical protein